MAATAAKRALACEGNGKLRWRKPYVIWIGRREFAHGFIRPGIKRTLEVGEDDEVHLGIARATRGTTTDGLGVFRAKLLTRRLAESGEGPSLQKPKADESHKRGHGSRCHSGLQSSPDVSCQELGSEVVARESWLSSAEAHGPKVLVVSSDRRPGRPNDHLRPLVEPLPRDTFSLGTSVQARLISAALTFPPRSGKSLHRSRGDFPFARANRSC